jgi:hypothetical protein
MIMGQLGRERVESRLAWRHQAPAYLAVFDELSGRVSDPTPTLAAAEKEVFSPSAPNEPAAAVSRSSGQPGAAFASTSRKGAR